MKKTLYITELRYRKRKLIAVQTFYTMFKSKDDSLDCRYQKAGFLLKLPFMGKGTGRWHKRWFVLKDGYLLYYGNFKKSTDKFDQHPRGAIPMGNCTIEPYDDAPKLPSKYFAFKATHTNFGGGAMCLACLGKEEREEWMAIMRDCRRITYENALLGDAMIEKLNNASSQLTSENQKALEEFQANALRLRTEREAHEAATSKMKSGHAELSQIEEELAIKQAKAKEIEDEAQSVLDALKAKEDEAKRLDEENRQIIAEQERLAKEKEEAESQFSNLTEEAATLEEQRVLAEQEREQNAKIAEQEEEDVRQKIEDMLKNKSSIEHQLEKENVKRKKAEVKLKLAQDSVRRLDSFLKRSGANLDTAVTQDVRKLLKFFEDRKEDLIHEAKFTETVKSHLKAHKDYHHESRRLSDIG